jgi:hypothetical protein
MQHNIFRYPKFQLSKNQAIALILCMVIISLIFSMKIFKGSHTAIWENASITPQHLLKQVISQNSVRYLKISSMQVMRISSPGAGNLYIFDFRSPQLCGAGGCLYSVYHASGKLLLEFIANSYLPPKEKLIQVDDTVNQGFPCLIITQNLNQDNLLSQTKFCYQDGKYIRLNKYFITGGKGG